MRHTRIHRRSRKGRWRPSIVWTALTLVPALSFGQAPNLENVEALDDDRTDILYQNLTVDQIEDMDVVRDGEVIGEVEEVLGSRSGGVVALVIEYRGADGAGEREVAVLIDRLRILPGENRVETSLADAELDQLPEWQD